MVLQTSIVLAFALVGGLDPTATKQDLQPLQGTWMMVSETKAGQKVPANAVKPSTMTVTGEKYVVKMGDGTVEEGTIKVDASKTPKTIDVTPTSGENKGRTYHGIFEITGDTARDAFAAPDKARPTSFESTAASGVVVRSYKRQNKK